MRELLTKHAKKKSYHHLAASSFVGGIFWALGVTIGFSILIAILGLIAKYIYFIPFVGSFASSIIDFLLSFNKSVR